MQLSIVIVNYNVKHFLSQCLFSVQKATENISAEVFVVDNDSVDGSCALVKEQFPNVILIENKKNVGFAVANNQAIRQAKGKYILLLNPDTIVEEDTFTKCIDFMDKTPDAGGLGVKMIDGKGVFLPESKRALPTPWVAFYKIFGLSSLFSKSKKFGKYHLSYLDKNETHEIEVLAGAFMLMRKEALEKSGLLDEDFFMYGEDIDLSYRITLAGYKNYYFPETTIIHYKGESTKKGSVNYVLVFYKAMIIFAQKHFSKKNARIYSTFIMLAIYIRALLAIVKRFVKNTVLPVIDAIVVFIGYLIGVPYWEEFKFEETVYPDLFYFYIVPGYILIWILSVFFSGGYEKPVKLWNILKGIGIGSLIILVIYALMPEQYRFSRALILIGAIWTISSTITLRLALSLLPVSTFKLYNNRKKRIVITGNPDEALRVKKLMEEIQIKTEFLGFISVDDKYHNSENYIGKIHQLEDIIRLHKVDEIIFCAKDISSQEIISHMLGLSTESIDYKIAPPESLSIIGSNSINTAGDLYTIHFNSINREKNKRKKRVVDFVSSIAFIIFSPLVIWFVKAKWQFIKNSFKVFIGLKSWVGYYTSQSNSVYHLPKLKNSILTPLDGLKKKEISNDLANKLNLLYSKDYKVLNDINIILKGFSQLGRK